ncbi:protein LLP homolog [Macrosteles quadrilineatus]|uniref:protein LLP homolog n=1 Tax=Macrosteles quadrilineatus TaxID=74068 RepID=UPI0023E1E3B0|nr:protein LLP homolog [Macrosteles quadrilineatus]
MAKSLRSKWKRKMRSAKRERYGEKELQRLKTMLGINPTDVEMKDEALDDIVIVRDATELKNEVAAKEKEDSDVIEIKDVTEPMEDGRRVYDKKTMRDQHGNYPVWMSSRKVKKVAKRNKVVKKEIKKKQKKRGKGKCK